jgi:ribonuclease HI
VADRELPAVLVHADESCLGNDSTKPSPGGNAALIEARAGDSLARWDFYESSPQTTNNRMALAGAIATLEWVRRQWGHARVIYVSDSQYLIKGMKEWVSGWTARGWKRKGGPLENLALWQRLVEVGAAHQLVWEWIEGHAGHVKNEYANELAVRSAQQQDRSNGLVPSGFDAWLATERKRGRYVSEDPDREVYERLGGSGGGQQ